MRVGVEGQQGRMCCRAYTETGVPELGYIIPFGDLMVSSSSAKVLFSNQRRWDDGTKT